MTDKKTTYGHPAIKGIGVGPLKNFNGQPLTRSNQAETEAQQMRDNERKLKNDPELRAQMAANRRAENERFLAEQRARREAAHALAKGKR